MVIADAVRQSRRRRWFASGAALAVSLSVAAATGASPAAAAGVDAAAGHPTPTSAAKPRVAPSTPQQLRVVLAAPAVPVRSWSARLTWSPVPGAHHYQLVDGHGSPEWSGTASGVVRSGLAPGVAYGWRVQAVGPTGLRSAPSNLVTVTPPPSVPVGLSVTVSTGGATLHWQAAAGDVRFLVAPLDARGAVAGPARTASTTTLALSGLVAGQVSHWSVAATAADGTRSPWSSPVTVTAPTATPAVLTARVSVTPTSTQPTATVTVSWRPAPGAVSYRVTDYSGSLVATTSGTAVSVADLLPGARYRYAVASVNSAGLASPTAAVDVLVPRLADPATTVENLQWGGVTRTFQVAVPDDPTGSDDAPEPGPVSPRPLLIMLHGDADTAPMFLATTRILAPAVAAGEVVLAPESLGRSWNDGRLDPETPGGAPGPDDAGFVMAAVQQLVDQGIVDPNRVTVAGFSNGAGLAMRIGAQYPTRIAEVVSVAGALLADSRAVLPSKPMPVVLIHGDADTTQPWEGRDRLNAWRPAQLSQPDTRRVWQGANGATGAAASTTTITAPAWAPTLTTATAQLWTGLAPVSLYRLPGGTHHWPYLPCAYAANTGCSADARTDAQPESLDATAMIVSIAAVAGDPGPAPESRR